MEYNYSDADDRGRFKTHHWTHSKTGDGLEHIVLTGVVAIHQKGESEERWRRDQVTLILPIFNLPRGQYLKLRYWAPFVTINAIYNKDTSYDSGHAVDAFRLLNPGAQRRNIHLQADIAIRDTDAWLYRIGYHVTLIGEFTDMDDPI